jgi:hypothetical protein
MYLSCGSSWDDMDWFTSLVRYLCVGSLEDK